MPLFDYLFGKKKKGGDMELPTEGRRDPRLPRRRHDVLEGLREAGKGLQSLRETREKQKRER